jgi:Fe-S-cluster-containing hydrogenase component 2
METVKINDLACNDLPWKVIYDTERCTLCGSCVAACTFEAIAPKVERRRKSFSDHRNSLTEDQVQCHAGDCPEECHEKLLPRLRRL